MQGRYGVDNLSRFLSYVLLIYLVVTMFLRLPYASVPSLVLLVIIYFRTFSKNIQKRYRENQKFLKLRSSFTGFFRNFRSNVRQWRTFRIYRCPKCGQKIRIPRGKGRIIVRCPRCSEEFEKRS